MSVGEMSAGEIVARLGLVPHPEGGAYRETWRHDPGDASRGAGSAILFLLGDGERSQWHRVDADELWHFHAGAPLVLRRAPHASHPAEEVRLGIELGAGEVPQALVPAGWWQSAVSTGAWTLVGCTVSPAFTFAGFELAPPDFEPG